MAVFDSALPIVIAQQLLVELEAYEETLEQVAARRWDPQLSEQLSDLADRVQQSVGVLPRLAPAHTEFLITRAELGHALWAQRSPSRLYGRVSILQAQHRRAVERLRRACQRLIPPVWPGVMTPASRASAGTRL
ncbi:MAG TPA: hypothetical protein VLK85_24860 [Ramlibacter sp.]|nr:hypothetical protein [Ramlibacter sp.]